MTTRTEYSQYEKMLKSSSDFETKFFTTTFKDPEIERKFLTHLLNNTKNLNLIFFISYILIYIAMIVYGFINNIKTYIFYINISISLINSVVFYILYSCKAKSPFTKSNLELFIISFLFLCFVSNIFCFIESKLNSVIITRVIYIFMFSKYLTLLVWSRCKFYVWVIFALISIAILAIVSHAFENYKGENIGILSTIEILSFILVFCVRKFYDAAMRISFLQMIKYMKFFDYNKNLINCMSGFHMTFSGNKMIYMNDNIKSLLEALMDNNDIKGN